MPCPPVWLARPLAGPHKHFVEPLTVDRLLASSNDGMNPAALRLDLDCLKGRARLVFAQSADRTPRLATMFGLPCILEFMLLTLALGDNCDA
jgi:hypothetical protein